eukprot:Colp12_sorted_trinity150504_noHs@759
MVLAHCKPYFDEMCLDKIREENVVIRLSAFKLSSPELNGVRKADNLRKYVLVANTYRRLTLLPAAPAEADFLGLTELLCDDMEVDEYVDDHHETIEEGKDDMDCDEQTDACECNKENRNQQ